MGRCCYHLKDRFGNLVSGFYEFDADVVEKETGNFLLTLSDMEHNKSISGMPYEYTVYIGYCDGSRSIVNGSGINASVAGEALGFSIYLKDAYGYPSSVLVNRLQVRIILETDSSSILPTIQPRESLNRTRYGELRVLP
ncbi:unnamed protein product [Microthlaspi erraticum]|uniref:Uncharacterized protein n=1 Tax=Microthlaspi erraticum TaxID=1685480 RepID=A0A6D2KWZ1_9BRAS|nr:unnamed protein product [Microthlaspi erraticum]